MGALLAPAILRRYPIGRVCVIAVWFVVLCGCLLPARLTVWWIGTLVGIMLAAIAPLSGGMGAFQTRITPNAMQGRVASASNFVSLARSPPPTQAPATFSRNSATSQPCSDSPGS